MAKGKYNARKRKVKKTVANGVVHIHSTFNNTVVTITDKENFKVTLATEDETITGLANATQLNASGEQKVSGVITIPGGQTQEFTLSAQYDNIDDAQDQGKAVKFAVRVVGLNLVNLSIEIIICCSVSGLNFILTFFNIYNVNTQIFKG